MLLSASLLVFRILFPSLLPLHLKPILSQGYMASSSAFLLRNSCLISDVFGSSRWCPPTEAAGQWNPWGTVTAGRTKARTDQRGHLDLRGWSDLGGRLHSWLEIREKLGGWKGPIIKKELGVTDFEQQRMFDSWQRQINTHLQRKLTEET